MVVLSRRQAVGPCHAGIVVRTPPADNCPTCHTSCAQTHNQTATTGGWPLRGPDAFWVDLIFSACGETYKSWLRCSVTLDFEGVPIRTLNLEGLLWTKQTSRDTHRLDRLILERALQASKKS